MNPFIEELKELELPESIIQHLIFEREQQLDGAFKQTKIHKYVPSAPSIIHDAVVALSMGKNVLLEGPTGSGKTTFAEYLSYLFTKPMRQINCSVDLDAEALLGFKTLAYHGDKQIIDYIEGPVVKAMTAGEFLYIDEINMAKPDTLPILNGVLDYRRKITNPFTTQVISAKPGFSVIGAINLGYVGTVPLNEALKNRFIILEVPYLQGDELLGLLKATTQLSDIEMLQLFTRLSFDLVEQAKLGQIAEEAASIRALQDACDLASFMPPLRAIQSAIANKLDDIRDRSLIIDLAETYF
jgi:nitric oxide reductase NorQ protein